MRILGPVLAGRNFGIITILILKSVSLSQKGRYTIDNMFTRGDEHNQKRIIFDLELFQTLE